MTVTGAVVGFGLLALLVTLTPGLDTALVLRAAVTRGRRDAAATALGITAGLFAWGVAAAVGVSALLTASTVAYDALRLVGAAYVLWLGGRILWRLVRGREETGLAAGPAGPRGVWRSGRAGLLTNLLNPKVGAFYLSALPQFLPPHGSALATGLLLTCVHAALTVTWSAVLVLGAVALRRWLRRPAVARGIEGVTGVVLVGFGLRLALSGR